MKALFLAAGLGTLVGLGATSAAAQHDKPIVEPLTRLVVEERVTARFARADADRDGFLTEGEARTAFEGRPERRADRSRRGVDPAERRARLFARLDANDDGVISRAEFDARPAHRGPRADRRGMRPEHRAFRAERRAERGFAAADSDRDGRVSLAEARARAFARFERLDLNDDGRVTREERLRAREQRRERRRRG